MENKLSMEEVISSTFWKDIKGYEGFYQISNIGKIISLSRVIKCGNRFGTKSERISKAKEKLPFKNNTGYLIVELKKNGKSKKFLVHRLVGEYFLLNPENKIEINHKDCDKNNNHVDNLEWVSKLENENHAKINGKKNYKGNQYGM